MSDTDEIKSRLNIVDIIGKNVKLKKAGRNFKGLCPFHNEKTPSFIVSPDRESWHCFGCSKGGDIFSFVMEYQHIDFSEALEDLAAAAGVTLTRRPTTSAEGSIKEKLYEVNHLASEFYHYILTKHPLGEKGLSYFKNRGVSEKSMKTFMLGYSPNSWDGLFKYLHKKGYEDEILETAGLCIRMEHAHAGSRGYYDRFRGRVMFTLKDHRGNVVGFAGRVLDPKPTEAKYINTQETPVYIKSNVVYALDVTKAAVQKENEAIVMEGELDVISSFQAGIPNVVAIKGSALTEGHVRLLRRFTDRITFALDSDMAGDAAARRGIQVADSVGMDMKVVSMPSGKDPDEAARENAGLLKKAIKDAVPVYDYFLSSALKRLDATTAYGKKKISEEFLPVLAKIENPIIQNHYAKKLASAIDTSDDAIADGLVRATRNEKQEYKKSEEPQPKNVFTSRPDKLEIYILAMLLQGKTIDLFEDLEESGILPDFSHPTAHKIIDQLVTFLANSRIFLIKDFADTLPKELLPTLDEAFLWDIADLLDDEELFTREWLGTIREFKKVTIRRKIQELTRIAHDESSSETMAGVQKKLQRLTDALRELEKAS
jgi:DNA primase